MRFLEDAGRIYLSPDGDAGGESAADPSSQPGAGDADSDGPDPKLKAARDDAAKQRIKAREMADANTKLQQELAALKKRNADILKAAGLEADDDGGADLDALQKQAEAKERKAREALIRAEAKTKALEAGIRPDRVDAALKLADLSGADVDLDSGEVTGVADAMSAIAKEMPELVNTNGNRPGVDNHPSGDPKGSRVVFPGMHGTQAGPGDLKKFAKEHPDEYWKQLRKGVKIRTGRFIEDADGNTVPEFFTTQIGGDAAAQHISNARKLGQELAKDRGY